jgi:proline iminopeptidase
VAGCDPDGSWFLGQDIPPGQPRHRLVTSFLGPGVPAPIRALCIDRRPDYNAPSVDPNQRTIMKHALSLVAAALLLVLCPAERAEADQLPAGYLDNTGRIDVVSGGSRMIPIETSKGTFNVWVKRFGNNPDVRLLILHGGPAMGHEYLEGVDSYLPGAGIEYYQYDQLGCGLSDQPDDDELWEISRFVDEVDQVREALGLDSSNFYLYGHSWGGVLAMEYALAHPEALKGLIISNMMASVPAYNEYAETVLEPQMDPAALAEIKQLEADGRTGDPKYMELLMKEHYSKHVCRIPPDQWPDGILRSFAHMNPKIYTMMQGPSELGASGKLEHWDRTSDLENITVPTLVIGAKYDTMDPKHMEWMASQIPHARYLYCPNGSHLAIYDDQQTYFDGLIRFVHDVDSGNFE